MDLWQDIRYAARRLAANRSFAVVAGLTLALGIGATTAVFSAIHAVILNPLPFPHADRLAFLYGVSLDTVTFPRWEQQTASYEQLAALSLGRATYAGRGETERVRTLRVTDALFPILGLRPERGRGFVAADSLPGSERVVIVSYRFWEERLGGATDALGQTLALDGLPHMVVGVLPREVGPLPYRNVDLWLPIRPDPHYRVSAVGLRKVGVSLQAARAEAAALAPRWVRPSDKLRGEQPIQVVSLKERLLGGYQDALVMLAGAVGCVLLIACVNVANLLLARGMGRTNEMAIRTALGASRWRMVRHTLAESFLLSAAGAAAGLLVAEWSLQALLHFLPYDIPRMGDSGLDRVVLLFALALLVLTTLLAGLAPALQASQVDVALAMKEGSGVTGATGGRGFRQMLVVTEVALAMVMLIGAGLLIKTFLVLRPSSPGFELANRLAAQVEVPGRSYTECLASFREIQDTLEGLPGVLGVAGATDLPLTGESFLTDVTIGGRAVAGISLGIHVHHRSSTETYFRVMGMRVVSGRDFASADNEQSELVAIINQAMARRFWPGQDPLGRKMTLRPSGRSDEVTVIGVVQDARIFGMTSAARPEIYLPFAQWPYNRLNVVVHTTVPPRDLAPRLRAAVRRSVPDAIIGQVRSMEQVASASVAEPRFQALLVGCLAGLGFVLAVVGIHGMLSYSVNQRTREIGIRMALGAQRGQILTMIISEGMSLTLAGAAIAIALALWLAPLMRSLLYEVEPVDAQTYSLTMLLWCAVAVLACAIPARRAARVDPLATLRHE
jgi:putative ABC transport system permease protein